MVRIHAHYAKKKELKHRGTCRLPTIKKIEAWILKDLWLQVNRIHGSHYLQVFPWVYPQVTLMDPHPCPALGVTTYART